MFFSAICVPALDNISLKVWKVVLHSDQKNHQQEKAPGSNIDSKLPRLITKDWKTGWGFHRHSCQMPPQGAEAQWISEWMGRWQGIIHQTHGNPKKKYSYRTDISLRFPIFQKSDLAKKRGEEKAMKKKKTVEILWILVHPIPFLFRCWLPHLPSSSR